MGAAFRRVHLVALGAAGAAAVGDFAFIGDGQCIDGQGEYFQYYLTRRFSRLDQCENLCQAYTACKSLTWTRGSFECALETDAGQIPGNMAAGDCSTITAPCLMWDDRSHNPQGDHGRGVLATGNTASECWQRLPAAACSGSACSGHGTASGAVTSGQIRWAQTVVSRCWTLQNAMPAQSDGVFSFECANDSTQPNYQGQQFIYKEGTIRPKANEDVCVGAAPSGYLELHTCNGLSYSAETKQWWFVDGQLWGDFKFGTKGCAELPSGTWNTGTQLKIAASCQGPERMWISTISALTGHCDCACNAEWTGDRCDVYIGNPSCALSTDCSAGAISVASNAVTELGFAGSDVHCLDVDRGAFSSGTKVHIWTCAKHPKQNGQFFYDFDTMLLHWAGSLPGATDNCIAVMSATQGQRLVLRRCQYTSEFQWVLDGWRFKLATSSPGLCWNAASPLSDGTAISLELCNPMSADQAIRSDVWLNPSLTGSGCSCECDAEHSGPGCVAKFTPCRADYKESTPSTLWKNDGNNLQVVYGLTAEGCVEKCLSELTCKSIKYCYKCPGRHNCELYDGQIVSTYLSTPSHRYYDATGSCDSPTQSPTAPSSAPVAPSASPSAHPSLLPTISPAAPSAPPVPPTAAPTIATAAPSNPPVAPGTPTQSPVYPTQAPSTSPSVPPQPVPTAAPITAPSAPPAAAVLLPPSSSPVAGPSSAPSRPPPPPRSMSPPPPSAPAPPPAPPPPPPAPHAAAAAGEPASFFAGTGVGSAVAAGAVSSAGGGPALTQLVLALDLGCEPVSGPHQTSSALHPTGFVVGGDKDFGCVVAAVLIVIGVAAVWEATGLLLTQLRMHGLLPVRRGVWFLDVEDYYGLLRHPGCTYIACCCVFQGACYSSWRMMLAAGNAKGIRLAGALCCIVLAAVPVVMAAGLRSGLQCKSRHPAIGLCPEPYELARQRPWPAVPPALWMRLLIGQKGDWVSCTPQCHWVHRWSTVMRRFTPAQGARGGPVEFVAMLSLGLVGALPVYSRDGCGAAHMASAVIHGAQLLWVAGARPYRCTKDYATQVPRLILLTAGLACFAISYFQGKDTSTPGTHLLEAAACVIIVQMVVDTGTLLLVQLTGWRDRLQCAEWHSRRESLDNKAGPGVEEMMQYCTEVRSLGVPESGLLDSTLVSLRMAAADSPLRLNSVVSLDQVDPVNSTTLERSVVTPKGSSACLYDPARSVRLGRAAQGAPPQKGRRAGRELPVMSAAARSDCSPPRHRFPLSSSGADRSPSGADRSPSGADRSPSGSAEGDAGESAPPLIRHVGRYRSAVAPSTGLGPSPGGSSGELGSQPSPTPASAPLARPLSATTSLSMPLCLVPTSSTPRSECQLAGPVTPMQGSARRRLHSPSVTLGHSLPMSINQAAGSHLL
eukprot:TRINITY_DN9438_c0_g2_i1.p1 TRINITY_DN9438_c0_g2~~TRINITY_DN9438_c0_g2_i1.p1  ORF type:complete len:1422 (+),score=213.76 TRINITY_DN9438_c0_g2_i1:70-4266(+)